MARNGLLTAVTAWPGTLAPVEIIRRREVRILSLTIPNYGTEGFALYKGTSPGLPAVSVEPSSAEGNRLTSIAARVITAVEGDVEYCLSHDDEKGIDQHCGAPGDVFIKLETHQGCLSSRSFTHSLKCPPGILRPTDPIELDYVDDFQAGRLKDRTHHSLTTDAETGARTYCAESLFVGDNLRIVRHEVVVDPRNRTFTVFEEAYP